MFIGSNRGIREPQAKLGHETGKPEGGPCRFINRGAVKERKVTNISQWLLTHAKNAIARYRIFRFGIMGIVNSIFGLAMFPILYYPLHALGVNYIIIMSLSYIICTTFSYMTTKTVVFRSNARGIVEFLRFSTFYLACYLVNLVVLPLCVEFLHISPVWVQAAMVPAIMLTSYLWHSKITFRPGKPKAAEPHP